jgi:agmatinase
MAAKTYGSLIISADEVHEKGVETILKRIPNRARYYITIDIDGIDPSIAPGVGSPTYGGLTYPQVLRLLRGIADKGKIAGYDIVEVRPEVDVLQLTSYLSARLTFVMLVALSYSGQIGTLPQPSLS